MRRLRGGGRGRGRGTRSPHRQPWHLGESRQMHDKQTSLALQTLTPTSNDDRHPIDTTDYMSLQSIHVDMHVRRQPDLTGVNCSCHSASCVKKDTVHAVVCLRVVDG